MSYPHAMRLHGPWEYRPLSRWVRAEEGAWRAVEDHLPAAGRVSVPGDWGAALGPDYRGRVRYTRRFGRPTGLASYERVWLVIEGVDARGNVALNGRPLGEVVGYAVPAGFDVTEQLSPRNELEIVAEAPPQSEHGTDFQSVPRGTEWKSLLRPGREGRPGGLVREIRLEVRHENFLEALTVHVAIRDGVPVLRLAAVVAGPETEGLNLHLTGMRRELAFVPVRAGQAVTVEATAAEFPRWTPGAPCQMADIDVRLLRHGEAVWETTLPTAAPQTPLHGGTDRPPTPLDHVPTEEELQRFDAQGIPVTPTVPAAWAPAVCGRLAHHPSIVAWGLPAADSMRSLPESQAGPLAACSYGRPWVSAEIAR